MSRSRLYLAGGVSAAFFVAFATWLIGGWGGATTVTMVSDLGSLIAGAFALVSAMMTARANHGRQRWAWAALAVGVAGWFCGDALWTFYDVVSVPGTTPFPSAADAGYLLFSFATCLALVLLPIGRIGQSQTRLLLDGVIVAASLFVVSWGNGLDTVFRGGAASPFAFAVSLAYPLADLVLLTVALLVLVRARAGQRAALTVLTVAIGFMAVSDSAFVILSAGDDYASGNLVDVGWLAGLLLLGVAAMIGSRSSDLRFSVDQDPARSALWLPYAPLPLATICMVNSTSSTPLLVAALLLATAILVRHFIVSDENRRLLAEVSGRALRDPLTGLANRTLFEDRLTHAMALHIRDARSVGVLSVDLDDFKLVNDSLGHPAGDALLRAAAGRILASVGPGDTVARIGGDEFAILLEEGPDPPLIVAHRICDAFDQSFAIDGHDVFMRPSVGVASGSADGHAGISAGTSAENLLQQADLAMYAAKRSNHGGVQPFTVDMKLIDVREVDPPRDKRFTSRRHPSPGLQLLGQLRRAIDQGELTLVYQPKFTVSSGHVAGVEALVRWDHPQRGLMLPDEFLPLARQNGLMGALTEAVVQRAVRDAANWRVQGTDVPFAVNLFPPSLGDLELPNRIARILTAGGLPTECLTVEITEDFLVGNIGRARSVLNMLRKAGIRVSIDDFGTGYSALSYLRELPIDELKFDRQFIAPMLEDERADVIVSAMIDLAHRLGMTCVAEGVEDAATAARLAQHGCDAIQGYYCSWPVPASSVLDVRPIAPAARAARTPSREPSFDEC